MTEQIPCKHCNAPGQVTKVDDLYYARCSQCTKWGPYEFLGATRKTAIAQWNLFNQKYITKRNVDEILFD